ncbi:putative sulfite oxidase, partial [Cardiosporidium cionae]
MQAGIYVEGLPEYTPEQIASHKSTESRVWVTYKRGVYDITDFIELHPGGASRISLASGASIDPFWALYAQHHTNEVYELLEEMRIGNLIESTTHEIVAPDDPFKNEPRRHPALKVVSLKPFNAETPLQILCDNFITPNALFFVRNHLPVPKVNIDAYRLTIHGLGIDKEISLTVDEIRSLFKKYSVTATIQCAGNRRNSFGKIRPVKGLSWSTGAISTAIWSGALLKDVLKFCGVSAQSVENLDIEHIHFEGMYYKREIILAYEMNGEPLPVDHGFPLRAIVPGVVGARDVKWLKSIVLSSDESPSFWQQHDYRIINETQAFDSSCLLNGSFSPSIDWSTVDWRRAPSIQEYPVQSGICYPTDGSQIEKEEDTLH